MLAHLLRLWPLLLSVLPVSGPPDVRFTASGPGGLRIEGVTHQLSAEEKDGAFVFTVPLASVGTGIALRDRHMHEKYLEDDRFPTATLSVPRAGLKLPADGATQEGDAPGQFDVHGVTHAVTVHYRATRHGAKHTLDATFPARLTDHGIQVPSYLGVTVKPDLTVHVVCTVELP